MSTARTEDTGTGQDAGGASAPLVLPRGSNLATAPAAEVGAPGGDARLDCVLRVLRGATPSSVAREAGVEAAVVHRWVRRFTEAGAAGLDRPEPGLAQRDRFLATVAREMRTPLAVARGWTDLLADGDLPAEVAAWTVDKLGAALSQLDELTQEVEYLAAASLGRLRATRRAVPATDLAPGPDVVPVGDLDATVETDPRLAVRVVRDLWAAAETAPRPTSRQLQVRDTGLWVELRVVRTGEPIDAETLHALFEPFDQEEATGATTGLYLARALSVVLGGTVGLEQDPERAVFWLRLPAPGPRMLT